MPDVCRTERSNITARLAGVDVPATPLSPYRYLRTAQQNLIATYPRCAYQDEIFEVKFPGFHHFVVNNPVAIRRVLLDEVRRYPKADIEHRILGPLLGQGLITSEGPTWHQHRRLMAPFFDRRSVAAYAPGMVEAAAMLAVKWARYAPGTVVDVADSMMRVTLEIIARSMFSSDSGRMVPMVRQSTERYQRVMMFGTLDFIPGVQRLWGDVKTRRGKRILQQLDQAMYDLIDRRLAEHDTRTRHDLMDGLLHAGEGAPSHSLSPTEVRDQVMTMFAAGHETTALALTWTWYLLAMHPQVEQQMHQELDAVLRGAPPTYGDIENLPYTRMVLQEAMRLYPAVYTLAWRQASEYDVLCGRSIPRGATVAVVPWLLHRHERLWERAGEFRPERFMIEATAGRDRFAYLPFRFGPRVCIGAAFAMMESMLVLVTLAQRFRLRLAQGARIELQGLITLRPQHGMPMVLESR